MKTCLDTSLPNEWLKFQNGQTRFQNLTESDPKSDYKCWKVLK